VAVSTSSDRVVAEGLEGSYPHSWGMSEGDRERRESGRAALELPVQYERLNALLSDYTHNISRGGTFIRTDQPLQVGTSLSFTVQAPALGDPIVLRGVVRWVVDPAQANDGRPSGMGIAFIYDSLADKEAVEERLDKLMGKPAPAEPPEDGPR
jgi:type IV pilus assembly protein PilZ